MAGNTVTHRVKKLVIELWVPVLLITGWWVLSASSKSSFFPPLSGIVSKTGQLWIFDHTVTDLLPSLKNLLVGFFIAVGMGIGLGMTLAAMPRLLDAIEPELEFLRAIPAVALVPVAIIAIGLGDDMRIFIIAFGALWPILINTIAGAKSVDPAVEDVCAAFNLSRINRIFLVRLPAAAPQILAGARTSLSIAVVLVVVSEISGATRGLGYFVLAAQRNYAITNMWTGMLVLGIVGYGLNLIFRVCEARLLQWHPTYRANSTQQRRRTRRLPGQPAGAGS
jgi:ABC-type nitrate/sulfonate/bicarbonate transport system permease component